jgi:hypothetical protein
MASVRDIILRALEDVGVVGVGQTPLAEDMNFGLARFNAMIGQFNRRRWLVYHTVDVACTTTGLNVYSVGLNGNFAIPRPDKLEDGCYFRQYFSGATGSPNSNFPFSLNNGSDFNSDFNSDFGGSGNGSATSGSDFNADFNADFGPVGGGGLVSQPSGYAIDYPLALLQSREDWNRIALKDQPSWPSVVYYDAAYTQITTGVTGSQVTAPNGFLYINPVPFAGQFELHILVKDVLATYANLSTMLSSPPEYEEFFEFQLALRFCVKYQIDASKELLGLARASAATIRSANTQVPILGLPSGITSRGARYNIYSDRLN